MGNRRAQAGIQSPRVHNDLAVMHPAHRFGRHFEVTGVLDVDDEHVGLRYEAADRAERLATLFSIYLESNFDRALLHHTKPPSGDAFALPGVKCLVEVQPQHTRIPKEPGTPQDE